MLQRLRDHRDQTLEQIIAPLEATGSYPDGISRRILCAHSTHRFDFKYDQVASSHCDNRMHLVCRRVYFRPILCISEAAFWLLQQPGRVFNEPEFTPDSEEGQDFIHFPSRSSLSMEGYGKEHHERWSE